MQEEEWGFCGEGKMQKKFKFILWIALFTIGLSFQKVDAQQQPAILESKPSLNGLETSDYRRVRIGIEPLNEAAKQIGLTEERIRSRYELRLRQYGLEPVSISDQTAGFVYIGIHVVGKAFHTWVDFGRPVVFNTGKGWYTTSGKTWFRSETGTHGGDPEFILQGLDSLFDEFLNEYLKSNSE